MKTKIILLLVVLCFFIFINLNIEKKYLDKIQLISNGTFENISVTILLAGNNIYEDEVIKLLNSPPFFTNYDFIVCKEDSKDVIIINFNKVQSYEDYKYLKNLFMKYNGKYYDYLKVSGTYKIRTNNIASKLKNSIRDYIANKSFKVEAFENDNLFYISNNWIMPNIDDFNIAICEYPNGTYLFIGLPEIMMNY